MLTHFHDRVYGLDEPVARNCTKQHAREISSGSCLEAHEIEHPKEVMRLCGFYIIKRHSIRSNEVEVSEVCVAAQALDFFSCLVWQKKQISN